MKHRSAQHHWGPNLSQYHYVEKRYGKNARAEVFLTATLLIVLILGSVVVMQISETDAQRKARIEANEAFIVRIACKLGERACSVAQEDARRVKCKLFPEDCSSK